MIKTLKLTNFRQHEDRTVNFGAGLSILRGPNEVGKTSVAEAVAYALFGAKALRDTLDGVVTWGEPTGSLKVELTLDIEGVEYHIKRGKPGAEIVYAGGSVTGQTEVTNFAAKLLRVDAAAAAKLTMASQGEIRGALEAGTKATTELIERLAEFSQIDDLIELIQEKLPLGSAVGAESAIAQLESDLVDAQAGAVEPDLAGMPERLLKLAAGVVGAEKAAEALETAYQAAQVALDAGQATEAARERLEYRLTSATRAAERFKADRDAASAEANIRAVFFELQVDLEQEASQLGRAPEALAELKRAQPLMVRHTGERVAGSLTALRASVAAHIQAVSDLGYRVSDIRVALASLEGQLSSGTCGFCGQDFSELPEVAKKNAQVQAEIEAQELDLGLHTAAQITQKAEAARLQDILKLSSALDFPLPHYVEREDDLLPPHFRWTGLSEESLTKAKARLAEIAITLADMAKTKRQEQLAQERYDEIRARLDGVAAALTLATDELHDAPTADVDALRLVRDSLRTESRDAERAVSEARSEAARVQAEMVSLQQRFTAALARVERVRSHIAQRKLEVAALALNNGLLKKVRAARPVIADKLWNIVLSAVGGYFSEIRGEKSRVSKNSDGFQVDGHPITSLSGSTKDALGLAIRVALVKTFLPNTPFLLLDEPCAAMDENRTGNLLGFVASCGFTQVIACSHDSLSLSFADHVIQLGD